MIVACGHDCFTCRNPYACSITARGHENEKPGDSRRGALKDFRQKIDDALGDLEDDMDDLEELIKEAGDLEAKLEAVAKIAGGQ